jgi:hypothetical protein
VPEIPQRPFVPHRTPGESREVVANSEFFLTRPFVPGGTALPSITEFADAGREEEVADELPPVEHFMDPLPEVVSFAPDSESASIDIHAREYAADEVHSRPEEGGWIEDDWQRYDWRAAAALGEGPETEASTEWAKTDWEVSAPVSRERRPSAAEALASALDQIAQRIREGELTVPSPEMLSNPAAIAASLAALLGVKR